MDTADHTADLGPEFARETGEITARRWQIGLSLYLLFAGVGVLVEWQHYPQRGWPLLIQFTLQSLVAIAGCVGMRGQPTHPKTAWIVMGGNVSLSFVIAVYNATVHGDMLYVLLTYLGIMFVSSVFIPWGARFQSGLNVGVIAAYVVGLTGGARGGTIPAYDYTAVAATAVFSALGALYIDQYRRQLFEKASALREAYERLHAANAARTELLSGLAHDMRTPLGVLIGYTDILRESTALPNELQPPLRSIRREALELLSLVDGVLDLARLEAGRLPFQRATFQLAPVLDPLRETTEDQLRDSAVRLRWVILPSLMLDSDPGKVREIVRNLLSNAVKYTQHGEIRLTAATVDAGVEIAVADTGVGIAPEQRAFIFNAFHRIEQEPGQRLSGLGFGLYMVKLLVTLAGGRIDVESTPGAGSTFRVWLPPHPPAAV